MFSFKLPEQTDRTPVRITVIGAGGTGARLIPLLVKTLRGGDQLHIIDPDRVGTENLLRQHFGPNDVGRYKAEVMVSRYTTPGGAEINAFTCFVGDYIKRYGYFPYADNNSLWGLVFGCVDNNAARKVVMDHMLNQNSDGGLYVYIDMGNAMRTGQVVMTGRVTAGLFYGNKFYHPTLGGTIKWDTPSETAKVVSNHVTFNTVKELYPNLLTKDGEDQATQGCAIRIDTQTVIANQLAATFGYNIGLWFLNRTAVPSGGTTFSATTGAAQAHPWVGAKTQRNGIVRLYTTQEALQAGEGRDLSPTVGA